MVEEAAAAPAAGIADPCAADASAGAGAAGRALPHGGGARGLRGRPARLLGGPRPHHVGGRAGLHRLVR